MSTFERIRDTQFKEWSKLLMSELGDKGFVFECVDNFDQEEKLKQIELIIARRTYDLAMFIVHQEYKDDLRPKELLQRDGKLVLMVPENVKEWYEVNNNG